MHPAITHRTVAVLACSLFLAACSKDAPPAPAAEAGSGVLFEGARLIPGDGSPAIEDSAFLVENGDFRMVGRRGQIEVGPNVAHVDLTGKTVMPALLDIHTHPGWTILKTGETSATTYSRDNLADHLTRYAYYGISGAVSMGIDPGDTAFSIRDHPIPGAALLWSAGRGMAMPNAGPGREYWRPIAYGVSTDPEARSAVRELAAKNVVWVKIWVDDRNGTVPKLTPALYRSIIEEAHKNQLRVVAHIYYLADAKDLVRAGIDGFAHGVRDRDIDDEFVQLLTSHPDVFVIPNLPLRETTLQDIAAAAETLPPIEAQKMRDAPKPTQAERDFFGIQARNLARLNAAGIRIGFGTDSSDTAGWDAHQELADMVVAGLTPAQAITAATKTSAGILGVENMGTVGAGKRADFLVLDANPLDDINNTRRISQVYLHGEALDRAALRAELSAP